MRSRARKCASGEGLNPRSLCLPKCERACPALMRSCGCTFARGEGLNSLRVCCHKCPCARSAWMRLCAIFYASGEDPTRAVCVLIDVSVPTAHECCRCCWRPDRGRLGHGAALRGGGEASRAGKIELHGLALELPCCEQPASLMRRSMSHARTFEVSGAHTLFALRSRRCSGAMGFRPRERSPCESHSEVLISPTGPRRSLTRMDPPARKPWGVPVVRASAGARCAGADCAPATREGFRPRERSPCGSHDEMLITAPRALADHFLA